MARRKLTNDERLINRMARVLVKLIDAANVEGRDIPEWLEEPVKSARLAVWHVQDSGYYIPRAEPQGEAE